MSTYPFQRRAWIEVDLDALASNVGVLMRRLSPGTALMAVVKADAYGHGAVPVAQQAIRSGAHALGVATVPEGIELRDAGIREPILIFGAVRDPYEIRELSRWRLIPTICDVAHGVQIANELDGFTERLPVHLKIDTGMSRLGTLARHATDFWTAIAACPKFSITGIYSHLATAEADDCTGTRQQCARFVSAVSLLPRLPGALPSLHLANSAAAIRYPETHFDMVRTGLAIYGLSPSVTASGAPHFVPVLEVKARISQVKSIDVGTGVSYGQQFSAPRNMKIGVVSIGYADGVSRKLSGKIDVIVKGRRVPQIGAITMDQLVVDVTDIPAVCPGDVVTLLGSDGEASVSAVEWAVAGDTIVWEVLCGFKRRLHRVLKGSYRWPPRRTKQLDASTRSIELIQHADSP